MIGSRFNANLLADVQQRSGVGRPGACRVDRRVGFPVGTEYAFRHPLIRAVAYESQLKSERAQLHRQLAAEIERREPAKDRGECRAHRDASGHRRRSPCRVRLAHAGGRMVDRTRHRGGACELAARSAVADRLPADEPDRFAMQTAPIACCAATFGYPVAGRRRRLRRICASCVRPAATGVTRHQAWPGWSWRWPGTTVNDEATSAGLRVDRAARGDRRSRMLTATLLSSATTPGRRSAT